MPPQRVSVAEARSTFSGILKASLLVAGDGCAALDVEQYVVPDVPDLTLDEPKRINARVVTNARDVCRRGGTRMTARQSDQYRQNAQNCAKMAECAKSEPSTTLADFIFGAGCHGFVSCNKGIAAFADEE